jgi:hypothetical protein
LCVNDYADIFNVLKDQCPSYAAIKSEGGEDIGGRRSGRSISVSTPRNIDVTHDMIVKDQIKLRDTLNISYDLVFHIVHQDLGTK